MKIKNILLIIVLLLILLCYQKVVLYNKEIFSTLIQVFIPSLFPALLLTNLFIQNNGIEDLYKSLYYKKNKLKKSLFILIIIFISLSLGAPSMIFLFKRLKEKQIVNDTNYNILIDSLGCISFPFVYGIALNNITNLSISLFIIAIYLICALYGLCLFKFQMEEVQIESESVSFYTSFLKSLRLSINGLINITGSIMFFSLFLFLFEKLTVPYNYLSECLVEFSYPLYRLSLLNNIRAYTLLIIFILFPSLSIIFQINIFDHSINLKKYIKRRFIIALIGLFMFNLLTI